MRVEKPAPGAIQEEVANHLHAVVELAGKGDATAFRELFERYHERLYRYAHARLGDPEEARDAVQEIFLGAWRGLAAFRDEHDGAFPAWLFGIARNVIGTRRRRGMRTIPFAPDSMPDGEVEFEGGSVSHHMLVEELARLPEPQREVLVLRFLVGLTAREVASAIGKSEGAVTALQLRGLRRLYRQIGEAP